jgi:hypothetical protein
MHFMTRSVKSGRDTRGFDGEGEDAILVDVDVICLSWCWMR